MSREELDALIEKIGDDLHDARMFAGRGEYASAMHRLEAVRYLAGDAEGECARLAATPEGGAER